MNKMLTGKVAVVTGGTRGLGRAMARGLAEVGCEIVVVSRNIDACEQVAADIRSDFGVKASAAACHVGRWSEIERFVNELYAAHGRADILINNAGLSPLYESESTVTEELFDKVIAINLKGPFRLSSLIGERMKADGKGGSIINVTSMAAVNPIPKTAPYAAAKAGLNALTVAFARALGPTVRVNAIMCGPFLTDVSQHWDMQAFEKTVKAHALQRAGAPDEVVGTALYLATDASSFTSGAVIPVTGGQP
ncbi:SDR family NAD(P)-dependent oxidoreductase [Rhodococcus sp. NPDC056960]|uniref:SDR family NAD(P)-dependent oxidoreductase n=1 Tax=Rhodococcus TaxID=1827 RepID=UPI0036283148